MDNEVGVGWNESVLALTEKSETVRMCAKDITWQSHTYAQYQSILKAGG